MKKYILIAMLGLTPLNAYSQTTNQDAAIEAFNASGLTFTSPEAQVLKEAIAAQTSFSNWEVDFLYKWILAQTSYTDYNQATCTVIQQENWENKSPIFAAHVKAYLGDPTGWTQEMIESDGGVRAAWVANLPNVPDAFKQNVFNYINTRSVGWNNNLRTFFKAYRKGLSKSEQINVSQQQKDLTIDVPNRTEEENAWLAEVSADLIALQLNN